MRKQLARVGSKLLSKFCNFPKIRIRFYGIGSPIRSFRSCLRVCGIPNSYKEDLG